jgi:hypothetical protein
MLSPIPLAFGKGNKTNMAAAPENMDFDTSRQPSTSSSATNKKRFEVKKVRHVKQQQLNLFAPLKTLLFIVYVFIINSFSNVFNYKTS